LEGLVGLAIANEDTVDEVMLLDDDEELITADPDNEFELIDWA
jgi:hypothetical protein